MRFNRFAVLSVGSVLSMSTAITMTAASAGIASAATAGHPKHHSKPVTQVTGSTLAKALVPASAFGSSYSAHTSSTGKHLWSTKPAVTLASQSCKNFQVYYLAGYGDTAEAGSDISVSDSAFQDLASNQPQFVVQDVAQFASSGAASTFFKQLQQKYNQCPSITFTTTLGSIGQITETVTNQNVSSTTFYGHPAFQVDQADQVSDQFGDGGADSLNTTVVVAGDNVYQVQWLTADDLKVPGWLISKLLKNTQALYKA